MRSASAVLLAAAALFSGTDAEQVLLAGDSWTGGSAQFIDVFRKHGDTRSIRNIGVGGSTCQGWANGQLSRLVNAVKDDDVEHVWFICGGNDALANLLLCSPQEECVDKLIEESKANVRKTLLAVHEANPNVRVSAFGYDVFPFGAIHCNLISMGLLPDCAGRADCVNPQFFRIQQVYDDLAAEFDFFDSINILGALQASQGIPGASVGHPNVDAFSPSDTFAFDCIHPNRGGYEVIFEAYYQKYWSKSKPTAAPRAEVDVSALLSKAYAAGVKLSNSTRA